MSDINPELLPGDSDLAHYREHGWYISPPLFDEDELDRATDAS